MKFVPHVRYDGIRCHRMRAFEGEHVASRHMSSEACCALGSVNTCVDVHVDPQS